jgi:hypothetical protein
VRITAELRWFWAGPAPADFQDWFISPGPGWEAARGPEVRTDAYLRDSRQATLGIKQRGHGAQIEIKGLILRREPSVRFAGVCCPVELWGKWPSAGLRLDVDRLIPVAKQRWTRKFDVSHAEVTAATGTKPRPSGCDAEFTLIGGPDGSSWWSVGFEAFGPLDTVEPMLAATVAMLEARAPPPLPGGEAGGYPHWPAARAW